MPLLCTATALSNHKAMTASVRSLGMSMRPHWKTVKTRSALEIMLTNTPFHGVKPGFLVSTMAEMTALVDEPMLGQHVTHLTLGLPLFPQRLTELQSLAGRTALSLGGFIDSAAHVAMLSTAPEVPVHVWVKIDAGYARAGVPWHAHDQLLSIVQALHSLPHVEWMGLYSHSGNAYNSTEGQVGACAVALQETERLAAAATVLAEAGHVPPILSAGSTPAIAALLQGEPSSRAAFAATGVSELHPGNYITYDRQQIASGVAVAENLAAGVLASVCGVYPERGEVLVDAGGTALHKDDGGKPGMGWAEVDGMPGVRVVRCSQEHGVLAGVDDEHTAALLSLQLGDKVVLLPNHSCMAYAGASAIIDVLPGGALRVSSTARPSGAAWTA